MHSILSDNRSAHQTSHKQEKQMATAEQVPIDNLAQLTSPPSTYGQSCIQETASILHCLMMLQGSDEQAVKKGAKSPLGEQLEGGATHQGTHPTL